MINDETRTGSNGTYPDMRSAETDEPLVWLASVEEVAGEDGLGSRTIYRYAYTVDRSIRFRGSADSLALLDAVDAELRVRMRLEGGRTATWIFGTTREPGQYPIPTPFRLAADLRTSLFGKEFVLRAIVDADESVTHFEVDRHKQTVRVIERGGRETVYAVSGERRLLAEVDSKTGRLELTWEKPP